MKKVRYYPEDPFEFHKKVVAAKRPSKDTTILQSLEADLEQCYTTYNACFGSNCLSVLQPMKTTPPNREVLKKLYNYKLKAFQNLFISLTTTEANQRDMMCPNCTLSDCRQLDHYMPKSAFPEFATNPRNLMQCCSSCNQKKSARWLNGEQPIFLNLYLDELPQEQYLFIKTTTDDKGVPQIAFYLKNQSSIDQKLFNRIESHYKELDLCARFSENADRVLSDIQDNYNAALEAQIAPSQFWQMTDGAARNKQKVEGYNYWKSILILECCQNPILRAFISSSCSPS